MMSEAHKISGRGRELRATEKGRDYQATQKEKLYGQLLKKLRSRGGLLVESVAEDVKPQVIRKDFALWKHDYVEFVQTYEVLLSLIDDEQKEKLKEQHSNNLTEVNELKSKLEAHLSSVRADEAAPARSDAGRSHSSRMSCSESEVKAQLVLMRLKMQQDKVELETRAAMNKKKLLLKQKQEQLLLEQEQLEIETEQKINEAKLKVVNQFDPDGQEEKDSTSGGDKGAITDAENAEDKADDARPAKVDALTDETTHSETADVQPKDEASRTEDVLHRLADMLAEQHNRSKLPTLEPNVFRGKVEEFPMWLKAFETYIEHQTKSPIERLHFLGKYTSG